MIKRVVRVERDAVYRHTVRIFVLLNVDAVGIVRAHFVQRKNMQHDQRDQHDWQCDNMKSEESIERGTRYQVIAAYPDQQVVADNRNRACERYNHVRAPVRHLAPRQYVTKEAFHHEDEVDSHTEYPDKLSWLLV